MKRLIKAILENKNIESLTERIDSGALPALVSGLSPVMRANLACALYHETGRPIFIVTPDETSADALVRDLWAMTGVEPAVITSREFTFWTAEGVSRQSEQRRLKALSALCAGQCRVAVCTAAGLIQRTVPPGRLSQAAVTIENGKECSLEYAENALLMCGYEKTDKVEGCGQYSRRGGILDFWSPDHDSPVRCEFWGDEVDSMGFFDVDSQRRSESIDMCRILPAAEMLASMCDGGAQALAENILRLRKKIAGRKDMSKLQEVLSEDAERLREGRALEAADRYMELIYPELAAAIDYIPCDALVLLDQPARTAERAQSYLKQQKEDVRILTESGTIAGALAQYFISWDEGCERLAEFPVVMMDAFTVGRYPLEPKAILSITAKQLASYGGNMETAAGDVEHYLNREFRVVILAQDDRRAGVLRSFFDEKGIAVYTDLNLGELPAPGRCAIARGALTTGYEFPDIKLAVITDSQFIQAGFRKPKKRRAAGKNRLESYAELSVGDLVVHDQHGIGRFAGIIKLPVDGVEKDYVKICYAGSDALYVPATQLDMVSKYIGVGEDKPVKLSKMGGTDWHRAKSRAKAAAKQMAQELIKLYAERQNVKGHAFAPDSPWQIEFEESFGYQETDDQLRCIAEIKDDMEMGIPMDRLLCGDVGYGKTEVAFRAVMKCVLDGKQAAILVPTTVLAQQHFQTAMQRFFGYPIRIDVMSRFKTGAQLKQTLKDLQTGACDIVIGTHRLLQKDVKFKDLGLLIVDEEQRFGVSHKEHIKEMSKRVDVLTLSATPIPRTLNMAMSGIRDMSLIEEPPQDRIPVQTFVMEHDWGVVCDAIRRETQRGGQVYYLHNRVDNIERTAIRLSGMLEGASVAVAHGKMDEDQLSSVMESMVNGEIQVLVCTTIIETGIDIPNVNTLIIEDADKLGLAQLHQIRGRVGRSSRRASAYLTFRKDKVLTEIAEKRLSAIREFAEFNSGFRIAMRDLEIRGAGNLLGAEQSGHMIDVGYDMYLKLLEEAVLEEKGETPQLRAECSADLAVSANIPERYVPSAEQRMDLYRRIALIRTEEEADDLTDELIDRFGDPPSSVNTLVQVALLRGEASAAGIADISQKGGFIRFVITDFNMELISALYATAEYKGRIKVEASAKPCLSLSLKSKRRILDEARAFTAAYAAAAGKKAQ